MTEYFVWNLHLTEIYETERECKTVKTYDKYLQGMLF